MTNAPGLLPDELHRMLTDAVDDLSPAPPLVASLQRRARRRRRRLETCYVLAAVVATAVAVAIPLAVLGHHDTVRIAPAGRGAHGHRVRPHGASPAATLLTPKQQAIRECRHYAGTNTFLKADTAAVQPDGSVMITGHLGHVDCGTPDDVTYGWHHAVYVFLVAPSATAQVLTDTATGPADKRIPLASLPSHLAHDDTGSFFLYTGPTTGVSMLKELYHP